MKKTRGHVDHPRFKSPVPYPPQIGKFDVSGKSEIMCPQFSFSDDSGIIGQEDCLFLNIFVPLSVLNNTGSPLPVMFWIYGGSFIIGSNRADNQGPQYFIDNGVIVVMANYRLGALGFFAMGENRGVPGNAGLWDQNEALRWVYQHVRNFGGDPKQVTIFGESAGSLSVGLHFISPRSNGDHGYSKGLFQRAIMQSCSIIDPAWPPLSFEKALDYADRFLKVLGCDETDYPLACVQSKDMEEILYNSQLTDLTDNYIWMPVVDEQIAYTPFLPLDPQDALERGVFNKEKEVIIGSNRDEGILFFLNELQDPTLWEDWKTNFQVKGPTYLFGIVDPSDITENDIEKANTLAEYYVGSTDNVGEDNKQGMFDMFTDAGQLYGTYKMINYLVKHGVTVYEYILTYEGAYSLTQLFGVDSVGVCHADDLFYIWQSDDFPLPVEDSLVRWSIFTLRDFS